VFPVDILGARFSNPTVFFGETQMPVSAWSATRIEVAFPVSGIPQTGALDVTVRNGGATAQSTKSNAFTYVNNPQPGFQCFVATAAYGTPLHDHLDTFRRFRDGVLLKTSAGSAMVAAYYQWSPPLADAIAARPWLAAVVRLVLTPLAWMMEYPLTWAWMILAAAVGVVVRRRSLAGRRAACIVRETR
jgi:hypothetical protein